MRTVWRCVLLTAVVTMALLSLASKGWASEPLPEWAPGKTVRPTVSYSYAWFKFGEATMVRVPVHGKRRETPRFGGPMGEPEYSVTLTLPL